MGALAIVMVLGASTSGGRIVSVLLAALWLWTGIAYHGDLFASINGAARFFAGLFVLQGLVFVGAGVMGQCLCFAGRRGAWRAVGWMLIVFAGLLYPLIDLAAGHWIERLPRFTVTPCPLTIFTVAVVLLASRPLPWWLVVVPLLWSLIGGSVVMPPGVPQHGTLPVAGLLLIAALRRASDQSAVEATKHSP